MLNALDRENVNLFIRTGTLFDLIILLEGRI